MTGARRARGVESAERTNTASDLLDAGLSVADAARTLADRYGISERQARRYVAAAQAGGRVEIPAETTPVSSRVPVRLARRARRYADGHDLTLSAIVAMALAEFLDSREPDGR